MIIVGIDPGKHGAIVSIDEKGEIGKFSIPLLGRKLDVHTLKDRFVFMQKYHQAATPLHLFIEDVHAIHGAAAGSTFEFGFVCGAFQTLAAAFDLPYTLVQPKTWQAEIFKGIGQIRKPSVIIKSGKRKGRRQKGKLDTKKMSLTAAKRLFPGVDLRRTAACTTPHDGIVDALLIAEYGRRSLKA
jgi:hypothetical protein